MGRPDLNQRESATDPLDRVPACVIVTDAKGRITAWNSVAVSLLGWERGEVIGRDVREMIVPDPDNDRAEEIMVRLGGGEPWEGEFPVKRKDGSIVRLHVSDAPLFGADGSLLGFIGVSVPVPARTAFDGDLRDSRDQLEAVLESVGDAITVQAPSGKVVYANDAAARLIGLPTARDLLDTPVEQVMRPFEVLDEAGRLLRFSELPGRRALQGEAVRDVILRFRRTGTLDERWALVSAAPIIGATDQVQFAVNVFRDITETKLAEERLLFLARAGEILSSSLDYRKTLKQLAELVVPRLADWCAVEMFDQRGGLSSVVVAHADPQKMEWAGEIRKRYPPDLDAPIGVGNVLRTGRSELYAEIPPGALEQAAQDDEHLQILKEVGLSSVMIAPLVARERAIGTVSFVSSRPSRRYGTDDLALVEELARRASLAIQNVRLHEAERRTRRVAEQAADRTARLQSVTVALADAMDPESVASVVVNESLAALGASGAAMCLLDDDGAALEVVLSAGYEESVLEGFRRIPLEAPVPMADAVRRIEPVLIRSAAELAERYTELATAPSRSGNGAWAALPLAVKGSVIGAIGFSFDRSRSFSRADREFMLVLSGQAAQALERAKLYQAEQAARAQAEALSIRLLQLETISEVALTHLDLRSLLDQLLDRIRTIVSADRAVILLREGEELVVGAALGLEEAVAKGVRVPMGRGIAGRIAAQAAPLVVEDVPAANPVSTYLRQQAKSLAGVPLLYEGEVIGVLHVSTDERRRFTPEEVRLLELVAARAALAINQSQIYERELRISETLQRSLLPDHLPEMEGLQVAARYLPSGRALEVGGDWFDAVALSGGRVGLIVGDVVGHGLRAAALMGEIRNALRAYAVDGYSPSAILERLDRLVPFSEREAIATVVCMLLDPRSGEIVYSSAGHPPSLLISSDGHSRFLEDARSVPLGAMDSPVFPEAADLAPVGSTLLLYTDGLVERRDRPIDEGMGRLADVAASVAGDAEDIAEHVIRSLVGSDAPEDDIALMVARLCPVPS